MLNGSPVWSAYKDQKHDLFISSTPVAGYLTGMYNNALPILPSVLYGTSHINRKCVLHAIPPLSKAYILCQLN